MQVGPVGRLDSLSDGATGTKPSRSPNVKEQEFLLFTVASSEAKPASRRGYDFMK